MYIFSSYGFDASIIVEQYKKYIFPQNKKLLIIPFAGLNNDATVRYETNYLKQYGFAEEDIYVLDHSNLCDIISNKYDYIYVPGGDTFKLLKRIKELEKICDWVKQQLKTGTDYIGASAGAYICTSDIQYLTCIEDNNYIADDFSALNLIDSNIICHSDQYTYHSITKCKEFAPGKKFIYLNNTDVLALNNEGDEEDA